MSSRPGDRTLPRESFYEAQRRNRRSGWRFSALSVMAVLLLGLPLSLIVSPFLVGAGLVALDVVNLVVPMPDPGEDVVRWFDEFSEGSDGGVPGSEPGASGTDGSGDIPSIPVRGMLIVGAALVVPGMVVMGMTSLGVRRLFLRSGAGAVAMAAGARPPRPGDLEERQLVNVVEEMALAAGIPPPRVMVLDSPVANIGVAGRSVEEATLIVPRGLLDELGRAPTGAIVGAMLAVVVNGDLRAAMAVASVFQTFDLIGAALAAPYSRATRRTLGRALRVAVRPRGEPGDGAEAQFIAAELTDLDGITALDDSANPGCLRIGLQLPFLLASVAFTLTRLLAGGLLVTPVMGAWWRRRRLLADATAVELTRDPDALARALEHLQVQGATVPAGPWTHLFAVGPELERGRAQRHFERRRDEIWESDRLPGESRAAAFARRSREAIAATNEYRRDMNEAEKSEGTPMPGGGADLVSFLPPLDTRLDRLVAMGAVIEGRPSRGRRRRRRPGPLLTVVGWIVGLALLALIVVLFLLLFACVAALIYLALMFELLLVAPVVLLSHALLR